MKKTTVSSINYAVAVAILSAFTDTDIMNTIRHELSEQGKPCELFNVRRVCLSEMFGITPKTPIYSEAWSVMLKIRKSLFNPEDLGAHGKYSEIRDRLELYKLNGQSKTTWSEFSAHKAGKKDITDKVEKIHIEKKTGTGDWLYSRRFGTLEQIRKEYERKVNDRIRWDYEKTIVKPASKRKPERSVTLSIHWEKTWPEFFQILEGFNGDLSTWFKSQIVETENGYLVRMQEISTSEKKIAYLMQYNDN